MKSAYARTILVLLITGAGLTGLIGCKGDIACQSPPPVMRLLLNTPTGINAINADNAGQVAVQYTRNGQLTDVSDVQVSSATLYTINSYELIRVARQSDDTTHMYVLIGNKPLGLIQLKTYVDNSRCDGWTHASELRFNGQVVPYDNLKSGYALTITP